MAFDYKEGNWDRNENNGPFDGQSITGLLQFSKSGALEMIDIKDITINDRIRIYVNSSFPSGFDNEAYYKRLRVRRSLVSAREPTPNATIDSSYYKRVSDMVGIRRHAKLWFESTGRLVDWTDTVGILNNDNLFFRSSGYYMMNLQGRELPVMEVLGVDLGNNRVVAGISRDFFKAQVGGQELQFCPGPVTLHPNGTIRSGVVGLPIGPNQPVSCDGPKEYRKFTTEGVVREAVRSTPNRRLNIRWIHELDVSPGYSVDTGYRTLKYRDDMAAKVASDPFSEGRDCLRFPSRGTGNNQMLFIEIRTGCSVSSIVIYE